MDYKEKEITKDLKYDGQIIKVYQEKVLLPNGDYANRDVVKHAQAVAMLALTADNKMILEKQWREPVKDFTLEIPAGKLDNRDNNESIHAVKRELNEEIRYTANQIKELYSFYTSSGFTDEYMYLYLVEGLEKVDKKLPRDDGEYLEIGEFELPEVKKMIKDGKIKDAKTIMAIQYWELMKK